MPTILAFIIITSSALMYQTIYTIVQLYSLQGEINDLIKLEYSVNTKRVISSITGKELPSIKTELSYASQNSQLKIERATCNYPTASQQFNQDLSMLIAKATLTQVEYEQLKSNVQTVDCQSNKRDNIAYSILFVEYSLEGQYKKIIIINEEGKILKNTNVK